MVIPSPWLDRWPRLAPWLLLAVSLALAGFAACADRGTVFPGGADVDFVDADCYARMTRVEAVCQHPGAVIRSHAFENYPFGTRPHTTVPFDYAVWVLREIFDLATGKEARDMAGAWVSPLLGVVTIFGVWLWAERERLRAAWLALLVLAASPIVAHGFQLGRPDHQSLIMACLAWALAAEWAQWRAPSGSWGIVSGVAWSLGIWTSLYEPVILLVLAFTAGLIWNRAALFRRERLPGLAAGGGILLVALAIEGWRVDAPPGFGEGGGAEYFTAWSGQIAELASVSPWSMTLYAWTGFGLLAAPVLLWLVHGEERPVARAQGLLLVVVLGLTWWQARWGYFLPLVYALSLPWQLGALPARWRPAFVVLLLAGLWPMAAEWARNPASVPAGAGSIGRAAGRHRAAARGGGVHPAGRRGTARRAQQRPDRRRRAGRGGPRSLVAVARLGLLVRPARAGGQFARKPAGHRGRGAVLSRVQSARGRRPAPPAAGALGRRLRAGSRVENRRATAGRDAGVFPLHGRVALPAAGIRPAIFAPRAGKSVF